MTQISEAGRTRLYTRRQRRRIRFGLFVALVGAVGAGAVGAAAASWLTGDGWQWPALETRSFREGGGLFSLGTDGRETPGSWRFPITVDWPEMDPRVAVVIAAVVWAGWLFLFLYPVTRGLSRQTRHRGLAQRRRIRSALGARAARRAGRFTRPRLSRWQRFLLPTNAFGYRLLRPTSPKSRRWVWADWEQRIRIIARTGWGKGARLLIPMIRALPGPGADLLDGAGHLHHDRPGPHPPAGPCPLAMAPVPRRQVRPVPGIPGRGRRLLRPRPPVGRRLPQGAVEPHPRLPRPHHRAPPGSSARRRRRQHR